MDNLFFVLVVVFFVVAPILEKMLKGGRPQQQRRPRPGRQGMPPPRRGLPDGSTATTRPGTAESVPTEQDARELLPADLWEMLTGQRPGPTAGGEPRIEEPTPRQLPEPPRPSRAVEVQPESRPAARQSSWAEGAAQHSLEAVDEVQRRRERERRSYRRPTRVAAAAETDIAGQKRRHDAFHDRLDHLAPAATVRGRPVQRDLGLDFDDTESLRRAILLQEVLGRPKGLD